MVTKDEIQVITIPKLSKVLKDGGGNPVIKFKLDVIGSEGWIGVFAMFNNNMSIHDSSFQLPSHMKGYKYSFHHYSDNLYIKTIGNEHLLYYNNDHVKTIETDNDGNIKSYIEYYSGNGCLYTNITLPTTSRM